MARATGELLAWWVLLLALYTVFISTVSLLELLVGAGGAALGAAGARAVRIASGARTGPLPRLAGSLVAWPGTVAADTLRLAAAVADTLRGRRRQGRVRTLTLRPDAGGAWAAALVSSTPGSCVLDADDRELLVHVLAERPSALERALEAPGGGR